MKRLSLFALVFSMFWLGYYFVKGSFIKDMTSIYSADIILKKSDSNELLLVTNQIASRYSFDITTNRYDLSSTKKVIKIELVNEDISLLIANPLGDSNYRLHFRVEPSNSKKKCFMRNVFNSIKELFIASKDIDFQETKIVVYNTTPGTSLRSEKQFCE